MEGMVARWYSRPRQGFIEQYRSWAKLVGGHLREGSKVLEVDPGPGYLSIELAKLGKYEITGLDISKTFVGIAREKAAKAGVRIDFRQGDAAATPFPDVSFDFVACTSTFKNFPDPVKVFDEIFRVLKGGGEASRPDFHLRPEASLRGIWPEDRGELPSPGIEECSPSLVNGRVAGQELSGAKLHRIFLPSSPTVAYGQAIKIGVTG